ncbi:MAG: DNA gyrase subunit A, partial [Bacilli bacterium]
MSQDWKINMPLIHFQGNNGSIDGDGPAAYRYTEAKLSLLAEELVKDIEKNTVDMNLNFDDTELEPAVLPSFFPNLYVNGANGIAVALATEIPPHNLVEIDDAIIYTITHKNVTIDDLLQFVKGPDFPTGGVIYNSSGIRDIYATGRGRIEIAAKVELTEDKIAKYIVITEIPYQLNKKDLVSEIEKVNVKSKSELYSHMLSGEPIKTSKLTLRYLPNTDPIALIEA